MHCIKAGLDLFCKALGQKVSFEKSQVFFSPDIPQLEAIAMSLGLGVPRTSEVGRYPGFPINHDRRSNRAHFELMKRVNIRLEWWKSKCMSLAGLSHWHNRSLMVCLSFICSWSSCWQWCTKSWLRLCADVCGILMDKNEGYIY